MVDGARAGPVVVTDAELEAALRGLLGRGVPGSQAARQLAAELGVPRGRAYDLAMALKAERRSSDAAGLGTASGAGGQAEAPNAERHDSGGAGLGPDPLGVRAHDLAGGTIRDPAAGSSGAERLGLDAGALQRAQCAEAATACGHGETTAVHADTEGTGGAREAMEPCASMEGWNLEHEAGDSDNRGRGDAADPSGAGHGVEAEPVGSGLKEAKGAGAARQALLGALQAHQGNGGASPGRTPL